MENSSLNEIWEKLKSSKKVLISLHYGPDGDSLGACTAMKYVLERDFKIKVKLVSKDSLDYALSQLEFTKGIEFGFGMNEQNLEDFDIILLMDSESKKQFVGRDKKFEFDKKDFIINIDHHATNEYFGNLNYVDPTRPSACSVLLDLLNDRSVKFDKDLATRLLLGVYTDSGYFSHDNGAALKDAAFLIDSGADYLNGIVNKTKYNTPLRLKKYYALLYDHFKLTEIQGHKIGYSSISLKDVKKLNLNLSEVRAGINDLQEMGEIDIIFTLAEMEDIIKGSFRSRKNIDVSLFAKDLGGGGHKAASGFSLPKMPLKEAENLVLKTIEKVGIHKSIDIP